MDGRNISGYAKKVTTNHIFQAGLMVLGIVFTVSMITNNYHAIRWNKARLNAEKERLKSENKS